MKQFEGTTIVSVRRGDKVVLGGDGQVTLGNTIMKANANKVRRLYHERVLAGFAGGTADAFTLFERFEGKLEKHSGHLTRAAVELAKDWRTDRMLRRLEALLAERPDAGLTAIASKSHRSPETDSFLEDFNIAEIVSAGSSLKFCLLAAGEADIYPRMGRTMEWDTAAGHGVVEAAGGRVLTEDGEPLLYGKRERGYDNPHFIVYGDVTPKQ